MIFCCGDSSVNIVTSLKVFQQRDMVRLPVGRRDFRLLRNVQNPYFRSTGGSLCG